MSAEAAAPAKNDSKALWSNTGRPKNFDASVSHVCFSNLIVYTDNPDDEQKVTEILSQFIGKHPCRTILVIAQPKSSEAKLDVSTVTHTANPHGNRKHIACEQYTLKVSGSTVKELPNVLQQLLVSDLPVFLWWRGVFLTQKPLLDQLLPFVDRFIYDGLTWTDLQYTVPQVGALIEHHKEMVGFSNFNWARLRPWREFSADFFDSGIFEKQLPDLNRVRVEYMAIPGMEEGYQFRATLFIAWLAVQLEWEPVKGKRENDRALLQLKNRKGDLIDTELVHLPQTSEKSQSIQRIVMGVQKPDFQQDFTIIRNHEQHMMTLTYTKEGQEHILRKVPHSDTSVAELLFRELGRRVRNRVFEKSFKMAGRLFELLG
jgi:glucose-6-phosphate dehydrogenase assembly protein OpcA